MILDVFITIINLIISSAGTIIDVLINLLPKSPFQNEIVQQMNEVISEYIGGLNWFINIQTIISITSYWLLAITSYYIISIAMRWIKLIE